MTELTKEYRLVWNDDKQVIMNGRFESSITGTILNCFESDELEEIQSKILELGLIDIQIEDL